MFFRGRKAQATTELVVLGALIIMAFSYLMGYSEQLNRQQSYNMQTFRAALNKAGGGGSASYTKLAHRRMANVANPYNLGEMQTFSSSASVLWGVGGGSSEVVEVDGVIGTAPPTTGSTTETTTTKAHAQTGLIRRQSLSGPVVTTRSLVATDTVSETAYGVTSTLGSGGKYSGSGGGINRSDTWSANE